MDLIKQRNPEQASLTANNLAAFTAAQSRTHARTIQATRPQPQAGMNQQAPSAEREMSTFSSAAVPVRVTTPVSTDYSSTPAHSPRVHVHPNPYGFPRELFRHGFSSRE